MVMVLPSEAAVDALKEEVFEVETSDNMIPEEGPLPPGSPPRSSFLAQSKVRLSNDSGKLAAVLQHPVSDAFGLPWPSSLRSTVVLPLMVIRG